MNNQYSSKIFDMGRAIRMSIGEIGPALRTDMATYTIDQTNQAKQVANGLSKMSSLLQNAA